MNTLLIALTALFAFAAAQEAGPTEVVWCVPYDQPPAYAGLCTKALAAANTDEIEFSCVVGGSTKECVKMIAKGDAHLSTLDGTDVLTANRQVGLVPVLFENYGEGVGTSYYAVAAVRKGFCDDDVTLEDLRGVRSCHTGYRKTAGWYMPLGALLNSGVLEATSEDNTIEDDAETFAAFFSDMCAPRTSGNGPARGADGVGKKWETLCAGCGGDCTVHDKYYDYQGAFRCLMEDAGDVAFIKHSTIPEFAKGGEKAEKWAKEDADEFMLLCADGGCDTLDNYESCHLAKVPSHSVVGPESFAPGGEEADLAKRIQDALIGASEKAAFFEGTVELADQKNFVFKSGTIGLDAVTIPIQEAMGADVIAGFEAVEELGRDGDK